MSHTSQSRNTPPNIVILVSGGGSNMVSLIEAERSGLLRAHVAGVIAGNHKAGAIQRAADYGVPARVIRKRDDEANFDALMLDALREYQADLIVEAGYLTILGQPVLDAYPRRILNIHPALLPKFGGMGYYGRHVHEAVLAAGERYSGATVHYTTEVVDGGEIIIQRSVPVLEGDTPDTLAARVLEVEHAILPQAVNIVAGQI